MPAPARRIAGYEDVLAAPPEMIAEVLHGTLYLQPRPASPHALFATRLVHHGDVVAAIDPFAALALDLSLGALIGEHRPPRAPRPPRHRPRPSPAAP